MIVALFVMLAWGSLFMRLKSRRGEVMVRVAGRRTIPLAILAAGLGLFADLQATADGLVSRLPADGTWAEYDISLRVKAAGQERDHHARLRLSSVGKAVQDDQPCRWIELAVTQTEPSLPEEVVKVLIPEKQFRPGADLTSRVLKAWRKRGDGKPEALARNALQLVAPDQLQLGIGPVSLFLTGPLQEVKKLAGEDVTVEALGKLPCRRDSGKSALSFGKDREAPADFIVWQHPRAPFGAVKVLIDLRLDETGVKLQGRFEATLARMGSDAKSALPEAK